MPNKSGNAYGLTVLSPIKNGSIGNQSFSNLTRYCLQELEVDNNSPWARIPNTYLCRLFVLNDVFYNPESGPFSLKQYNAPRIEEHLQSEYLVFSSNFYGDLDLYLQGMWLNAEKEISDIWGHCVAFDRVSSMGDFVDYIKKCQVETTFYFNGSSDDPLDEQLKSLYLKQEFSKFAFANQGKDPEALQKAFLMFSKDVEPDNLSAPTWPAGKNSIS